MDRFRADRGLHRQQDRQQEGQGVIVDIILGIIGAVVGGYLVSFFTGAPWESGFNIPSMIVAIVGAIIVLFVYHAIVGRRSTY